MRFAPRPGKKRTVRTPVIESPRVTRPATWTWFGEVKKQFGTNEYLNPQNDRILAASINEAKKNGRICRLKKISSQSAGLGISTPNNLK